MCRARILSRSKLNLKDKLIKVSNLLSLSILSTEISNLSVQASPVKPRDRGNLMIESATDES